MDQTHTELVKFRSQLHQFNTALLAARKALQAEHDHVHPLWQDAFRKSYDQRWSQLSEGLDGYLDQEANIYLSFLDAKIRQLSRYLHG
jgi:hypothetical protein